MSLTRTYHFLIRSIAVWLIGLGMILPATISVAQSVPAEPRIDPRLKEVVEIVKGRTAEITKFENPIQTPLTVDAVYLNLIDQMITASYSRDIEKITSAVEKFHDTYRGNAALSLNYIPELYTNYSKLLSNGSSPIDIQSSLTDFASDGNWFERYIALSILAHTHATAEERQAALQKAQLALSLIPEKSNTDSEIYISYAKARVVSTIAHLHNLQGNSELALNSSLEYLRLTEAKPDSKVEVDLINNLIYSYSMSRDHAAQLYLSRHLLEIEKTQSSSVSGLSEMRISGVMNSSGRYDEGLDYAKRSIEKVKNPTVMRLARVNEAIALAGLGQLDEARKAARLADINLSREHMLRSETSESTLYLAYILAQAEDREYATQLYNRQLDVKAQKFFANNSRDTTAMLAELENSHERQAERDAATARESELQAMTIKRQRSLNRALMGLSFLMALAILAGCLFTRYRGRVLRKLEIKTREAASAEKLKTEFLGMISHELRTPLNGIIGISDFLANHHEDEDIRKKTGIVLQSGNELLSVVESLTDMARIDAGQLQLLPHDADLGASLAAIPKQWAETARVKGLAFTAFIDPAITQHHVDKDRIVQSINILLANAMSFTDSGRVHLHITATKTEPMALTAIVADTGQGMSELVQSRLFTPFMQADASRKRNHMGTGLSLAIAYALAEMMDGKLSVVSREGRGSEFTFTVPLKPVVNKLTHGNLPLNDSESLETVHLQPTLIVPSTPIVVETNPYEPTQESQTLSDPMLESPGAPQRDYVDLMQPRLMQQRSLHGANDVAPADVKNPLQTPQRPLRILIVDDINSNRDILRLLLESKGHICREAADGFTALASLGHQPFDVVIMDIHMAPMDGVEAISRIRTSGQPYKNVPIIALTADNDPNINAESMQAGANLFLTKPVKQEELFHSIDYLRQSESIRFLSRSA